MRKSEEKALGILFFMAACVAAVAWAYQQVGMVGFLLLCAILVSSWMYIVTRRKATKKRAFDDLALRVLRNRLPMDELSKIMTATRGIDFQHSSLIGSLKQIGESIDLALGSKNREIAESRMQFAIERGEDVVKNYSQVVSPYVISQVTYIISEAQSKFNTQLYINISSGCIAKAEKLKSDKGKLKHLELAKSAIEEGISLGKGDLEVLDRALRTVDGMISTLH